MLQALIGPITNLVGGYLSNKHEERQAKHQAKLQVIQNNADWESKMADASANSWKDEWFTIILTAPVLCIMWGVAMNDPEIIGRVGDAFQELEKLPDWFSYLLFLSCSASFGIRGADKIMKLRAK